MVQSSGYTLLADVVSYTTIQSCFLKIKSLSRGLVFVMGLSSGVIVSLTFFTALHHSRRSVTEVAPVDWLEGNSDIHIPDFGSLQETHSPNESLHLDEDIIANQLKSKVRVLCLVLTSKETYKTNAEAVKNTWGQRCNTLLFISNFNDTDLPVLKMPPGREKLNNWAQIKSALNYAYIHLLDSHDWVLRADDTTFVVMENLRLLLSDLNPLDPFYIGSRFKKFVKSGFMSSGAGYVLSKEAVLRLVRDGLPKELCRVENDGMEDVEMGRCMEVLNVTFLDSRDSLGRERFLPLSPNNHIIPDGIPKDSWYWNMVYYPPASGFNCCSDRAISFHNIGHQRMYALNYMVYHLRPYGISPHSTFNRTDLQILVT